MHTGESFSISDIFTLEAVVKLKDSLFSMSNQFFPAFNDFYGHQFEVCEKIENSQVKVRCLTGLKGCDNRPFEAVFYEEDLETIAS